MVDYNLYKVNDHLKPILRAGKANGLSNMNKIAMVAWCQEYDKINGPGSALDLAANLPPPRNPTEDRVGSTTATEAAHLTEEATTGLNSTQLPTLKITIPKALWNSHTPDKPTADVLEDPDGLSRKMSTKSNPRKRKQSPEKVTVASKPSKIAKTTGTSAASINGVGNMEQTVAPTNNEVPPKPDCGRLSSNMNEPTVPKQGAKPTAPSLPNVPDPGQAAASPTVSAQSSSIRKAANTALRKSGRVTKPRKPFEQSAPSANSNTYPSGRTESTTLIENDDMENRPATETHSCTDNTADKGDHKNASGLVGTHLVLDYGAPPDPRFDHLIPDSGLNMFEQMQRRRMRRDAAIRKAKEEGDSYEEPPPRKKAWDWRDHY